ncbi:GNAT family N-acetyltransferase [Halorarum halobium]|uniref:GNAT family N-acetyltransferase n=1 Tax=Halorarum halobium TaxID=3075121 RepID=UPI0028A7FF93|nr:GNAT family N-acetyltransferase [Halobaculum sp. XH14]
MDAADLDVVDLDRSDAEELLSRYREYGWWDEREREAVAEALAHTDLAIGLRDGTTLVASARVITDFVYYARVYDVIVAADRRGEGLGRKLLSAILADDRLADVNPVLLCRDGLVPFYESVGFEPYPETVDAPEGEDVELRQLIHVDGELEDAGGE